MPPVPNSSPLAWYGIRTKSNHEKLASTVLGSKGYEQYLPTYRQKRRWSDRVVEAEVPLFPGYLFCRFDVKQRLSIVTTVGVIGVVGFGNEPAAIPDQEIEGIQAIVRSGVAFESWPYFREGERVRVNRGSLEGVEGILLKRKNEWRVIVSVPILQRSISVEIDRDWISAM